MSRAVLRNALLAALLLVLTFGARPAAAQEEAITDFNSDITVATNGTLTVRETITVRAENDQINHGIFRDFPTTYTDRFGNKVRVRFDVSEVQRDGHAEPYDTESIDNGVRVRIGDADVIVDRGLHTYRIVYQTDRQIGFFDDHDELYWNVTGTGWAFPILHASADVSLPAGAMVSETAFYTGPQGARGQNAQADRGISGAVHFATTQPLDDHEGLTIVVGFNKGVVTPPTDAEKTANFFRDNAANGAALAGLLLLGVFYTVTWTRFGRDPARGPIIPLFAPPKNFSAAAVRFVYRMGYDRKAFAAAIIAMAVKGYLTISEEHHTYTLTRTGTSEGAAGLASTESAVARALLGSRNSIELKNTNHTEVSNAITNLSTALKREDEGVYFVTNRGLWIVGLVILGASGIATALLSDDPGTAGFILIWLSGWSAGTAFLLHRAALEWISVISGPGSRILNFFSAAFASFFALPFAGGLVFGLAILGMSFPVMALVALVLQGALAYAFYHLLKAPTLAGAKVRDEIEGFKLFLTTAEKNRLEVLHPPHITPEVFETFLPYAIALDAENQWSKKFEAEAEAAGSVPSTSGGYVPIWYSGNSFSRLGTSGFASSLGNSIAGATASAATAPGSSSGFSGGGSSGGGGGGGGGGGW